MNIWHQFPLVRVYLAIATGTSLAIIFGATNSPAVLLPGVLFVAVLLSGIYFRGADQYKYRWVFGLLLNLFFILLGYDLVLIHKGNLKADNFAQRQGNHSLVAIVDEPPVVKDQVCKTILRVRAIAGKDGYHEASGKILAYFDKDSLSVKLRYGDMLILGATPKQIESPRNPAAFDYRSYLAANYIYHQVFLRKGTWMKLASDQGSTVTALANKVRDKFLVIFRENGITGKEYAVASALILGSSDQLDAETRREYAGSGAMHILSVSGMHVAVIFAVLNLILGFMDKRNNLKLLKTIILILAIWFYAAITGFSPAVLRAAWMITFVIIGTTWMRQANIYNVLAASALLITIADPLIITNAGFQLSYIAVLGIVALEPLIYRLWIPRWWITNWVWKVIAVSIAAQIATFPLACYYFHQFANYFLLTNLVAIPISAFVIYAGIAVLITSPVHFISALLARLMAWLLIAMNSSIKWIEEAPGAVTRDVPFSLSMMVLVYLLIVVLFKLWISRRKFYVFLALSALLLIVVLNIVNTEKWQHQQEFVVYSVKKHTSFCFISGREAVLFSDSAVASDSMLIGFTMHPHWVSQALQKVEFVNLGNLPAIRKNTLLLNGECMDRDNYYQFRKTRVAFISHKPPKNHIGAKLAVDFLIIHDMPGVHMAEVCGLFTARQVIIDSSTPVWRSRLWQEECNQLGQKCYSVTSDGAFVASL
jgi:competence protein ComEC